MDRVDPTRCVCYQLARRYGRPPEIANKQLSADSVPSSTARSYDQGTPMFVVGDYDLLVALEVRDELLNRYPVGAHVPTVRALVYRKSLLLSLSCPNQDIVWTRFDQLTDARHMPGGRHHSHI